MDPSPEQIAAFGAEARRRRRALGLSAAAVAEGVAAKVGSRVQHQNVTAWERAEYGPGSRLKAEALDEVLGAGGELARILGGELEAVPSHDQRLDAVETRLATVEDQIGDVSSRVDEIRRLVEQLLPGSRSQ